MDSDEPVVSCRGFGADPRCGRGLVPESAVVARRRAHLSATSPLTDPYASATTDTPLGEPLSYKVVARESIGMDADEVVSQFAKALAELLGAAFDELDDREAVPELIEKLAEELKKASAEVHLIARR